jgi:hypothetical protein
MAAAAHSPGRRDRGRPRGLPHGQPDLPSERGADPRGARLGAVTLSIRSPTSLTIA